MKEVKKSELQLIQEIEWDYALFAYPDGYVLEIMCGTVAVYSVFIEPTPDELKGFNGTDIRHFEHLKNKIQSNTKEQELRRIQIVED
jgi:hypothetical protein